MREILFKAKRIGTGEWVEGYYVKTAEASYITVPFPEANILGEEGKIIEVDPSTICQCTGLTDKNGRKIWENDVVRCHKNPDDLVKVKLGQFYVIDVETLEKVESVIGWHTEVIETDAISKTEPFCLPMPLTQFYIDRSEFEVIGNIFDNPGLLEGGPE